MGRLIVGRLIVGRPRVNGNCVYITISFKWLIFDKFNKECRAVL